MCKVVNLWCGGTQGVLGCVSWLSFDRVPRFGMNRVDSDVACGVKIVFTFGVRKVIRLESNVAQTCTFH